MIKKIKVSVIVRTHNEQDWISRCLHEILKQKFENYEDLESRAGIKEPVNHLSKRIIEEISGETQFRLFVKK